MRVPVVAAVGALQPGFSADEGLAATAPQSPITRPTLWLDLPNGATGGESESSIGRRNRVQSWFAIGARRS